MKGNSSTWIAILASSALLVACGGGGSNADDSDDSGSTSNSNALNAGAGAPTGKKGNCDADTSGVNWDALMTETCPKLSDYNLFSDAPDPTTNPTRGGVPYKLATPLFSDYASKYRFLFVPEGKKASYQSKEVFEFPVGTVITKTFAMPENTAMRNGPERVLETRLLIHRSDGWEHLPYYWPAGADDANLKIAGKQLTDVSTINNEGEKITFDYSVPGAAQCGSCHSVSPSADSEGEQVFLPIGPKARNLNTDFAYPDGVVYNQLQYWAEGEVLEGLTANFASIGKAPEFSTDQQNIDALSDDELRKTARAYLDVNCAQCHRDGLTLPDGYAGRAGYTGLHLEFNRDYAEDARKFGVCKEPIANDKAGYKYDVVPGNPDKSYLYYRISTNDPGQRMPEIGRHTVHKEGQTLIRNWIDLLPKASCSS